MVPFPSDSLFPAITIFKKLDARDPQATDTIMTRAKQIGEESRLRENGFFERSDREKIAAFMRGLASFFKLASSPYVVPARVSHSATVNLGFARTGNNMRLATLEYISRTNFPADKEFTRAEWESLEMLPVTQVENELKQTAQQAASKHTTLPPGWLHP